MNEYLRSCITSDRGPCSPEVVNCCTVSVTEFVRFCAWIPTFKKGVIV
jgi:hypothetical protein